MITLRVTQFKCDPKHICFSSLMTEKIFSEIRRDETAAVYILIVSMCLLIESLLLLIFTSLLFFIQDFFLPLFNSNSSETDKNILGQN